MATSITQYEVQVSASNDAVWVHADDGSTVGRFGRLGIDLHTTVTEQLNGSPQCRLCTHGKPSIKEWDLFREKCKEWWGVIIPADAFNAAFLINK
jgi:hypothetical protein